MHIRVKKGLDIPLSGRADTNTILKTPKPKYISLNLNSFPDIRLSLLEKVDALVKLGQPLVENKAIPGQYFVSPAAGKVVEVRRGLKRRLLDVVIELHENEQFITFTPLKNPSKDQVLKRLMEGGAFPYIRERPFNLIANPEHTPKAIFIKAAQTIPYLPDYERQLKGHEDLFKSGIEALEKIAPVHLVHHKDTQEPVFISAPSSHNHTIEGPHPASNLSIAIREVERVKNPTDYVWTLDVIGALVIGSLVQNGTYFVERILSFCGNGVDVKRRGFLKARAGFPIAPLIENSLDHAHHCFISGDPLTGTKIDQGDFLEFSDLGFCVLPNNQEREPFHFLGLGRKKYSATRTYLSHFLANPREGFAFDTNQHGEHRAFVDGSIYEKVMPLDIPTMHLVKALMARDFELAEQLGALEVIPEDFALPQFICPSKVEMMEIVEQGLREFAQEMGQ